jgi:hypothetical protein
MPALQNRKFAQGEPQIDWVHACEFRLCYPRKAHPVGSLFAKQAYIYFTASVKSLRNRQRVNFRESRFSGVIQV